MALQYDLTAIPEDVRTIIAERDGDDYKKGERILSPITNALIWSAMGTTVFELKTPEDCDEMYARIRFQDVVYGGTFLTQAGEGGKREPRPITRAEVHAHIGLKTNCFPRKSRQEWVKGVFDQFASEELSRSPLPEKA